MASELSHYHRGPASPYLENTLSTLLVNIYALVLLSILSHDVITSPASNPEPIRMTAEEWMSSGYGGVVKTKRFTVDVPAEPHRRIKMHSAHAGIKMADWIRQLAEEKLASE
jgi:hypothetical protein